MRTTPDCALTASVPSARNLTAEVLKWYCAPGGIGRPVMVVSKCPSIALRTSAFASNPPLNAMSVSSELNAALA
jgi:hypothetical protein